MNYRREREHDERLIELVHALENADRLDLLADTFQIQGDLGALNNAQHRRPFDVELTFDQLSIVIESKVDSDENGRWNRPSHWQTDAIVNNAPGLDYLNQEIVYRYITYGTSELYSKAVERDGQTQYMSGPASGEFMHIHLDQMIDLVTNANDFLSYCDRRDRWLKLMCIEQTKRAEALNQLRLFAHFRTTYLAIDPGEPDFLRQRLLLCARVGVSGVL